MVINCEIKCDGVKEKYKKLLSVGYHQIGLVTTSETDPYYTRYLNYKNSTMCNSKNCTFKFHNFTYKYTTPQ